jgi:ABC-2 type transport system ATP-binding protein
VLQFLHVGKSFGPRWVVARFSCEVKPGESVRLAGAPGAGKSLLVRMALGEVAPSTGTVHVNGLNPFKLGFGARQRLRRGISAVRDAEPPLDMPADTWIALGLWCAGRPWADSLDEARRALDRLGLKDLAPHPFAGLARGQRLAVALVRGLARKPHLLLLDWAGGLHGAPAPVLGELERFVADGGACLATGTPGMGPALPGERVVELAANGPADEFAASAADDGGIA